MKLKFKKRRCMKFSKFKELCIKHKSLQLKGKLEQAKKIEETLQKEFPKGVTKLLFITIGSLEYRLKQFLEARGLNAKFEEPEFHGSFTYGTKNIIINNFVYPITYIKSTNKVSLEELYDYDVDLEGTKVRIGIQTLLKDFPEFEEVLWRCVESKIKNKKELEIKNNNSELNKLKEELEILVIPAKREERVSLLLKLINRLQQQNKDLEENLGNIELDDELKI